MAISLIRELWSYHQWANRRLLEVSAALGEEAAARDMGAHWSAPSLREMFVHLYGADRFWLRQWRGEPSGAPGPTYGLDIPTLAELERHWRVLEGEQRQFLDGLREADLERLIEITSPDGAMAPRPFGMMLVHVPNHATHHRSEIAAMLTIAAGPPPDTGINSYYRERARRAERT